MNRNDCLLIVGASARAAAFSALRAGMTPSCADLFADRDLQNRCPVTRLAPGQYPHALEEILRRSGPGPWMYTGALENYPAVLERFARDRPLWGNNRKAVALARSPLFVVSLLKDAGLSYPSVSLQAEEISRSKRCLLKPLDGAGGRGISFLSEQRSRGSRSRVYFQEYIEGDAYSATYIGTGTDARLLGVTQQLVGQAWLHAAPFHYCGSIGPVGLPRDEEHAFRLIGATLAAGCGLRGLFGIDCIIRDHVVWPVEINPRYTASVEVLEYANGVPAIALHGRVFDSSVAVPAWSPGPAGTVVGKAVLFAKAPLVFHENGPWHQATSNPTPIDEIPYYADIPHPGERIEAGKPILTIFSREASAEGCLTSFQTAAAALDHILFGP